MSHDSCLACFFSFVWPIEKFCPRVCTRVEWDHTSGALCAVFRQTMGFGHCPFSLISQICFWNAYTSQGLGAASLPRTQGRAVEGRTQPSSVAHLPWAPGNRVLKTLGFVLGQKLHTGSCSIMAVLCLSFRYIMTICYKITLKWHKWLTKDRNKASFQILTFLLCLWRTITILTKTPKSHQMLRSTWISSERHLSISLSYWRLSFQMAKCIIL